MNSFHLNGIWNKLIAQWVPVRCRTQRDNLVWLIIGLYLAKKVHLSAIVKKWPFPAKTPSLVRRLSRFLDNPAVRPAVWYRPVARQILERWRGLTLTLIIDMTKVGFQHQLIMVAVAYRRRALPLAWVWVPWRRGHAPTETAVYVLRRVWHLIPPGTRVILTGDAGFGSVRLIRQAKAWGWAYVLRESGAHHVCAYRQHTWHPFRALVTARDHVTWWENARLTAQWQERTHLFAVQRQNDKDPWLLASSLPTARETRQVYARRMWIEELFGDLKKHGVDVEASQLRHADRLSRLLLAVCLLYVWLFFLGLRTIKAGQRPWLDRSDRRDLSVARLGWDMLERCLTLAISPPIAFSSLLSGG
jgi:hypothetical protein